MTESWIIPCNIKRFNVIEHFKSDQIVVWKNSFTMRTGDTAYIYIGAPVGQIKYKCTVISDQVSDSVLQNNPYAIQKTTSNNYFSKKVKYVQLHLDHEYPDGTLTLSVLKEHGLGQVQIQARPDRTLKAFLEQIDTKLNFNDDN